MNTSRTIDLLNPFIDRLEALPKRLLLVGAGGGFDVYAGIPIYAWLIAMGKEVVLANLSFSALRNSDAVEYYPNCYQVTPTTQGPRAYFPEGYLAQSLDVNVWAFRREGVANLSRSYEWLCETEGIEGIVLVDGGTDSLMRGDEPDLGTPAEDLASLWAAHQTGLPALLAAIGFGIDHFHGICHYYFLEAVADLTREGGFVGTMHLLPTTPGVDLYDKVCTYAFGRTNHRSIVSSHILAAIDGNYGDFHATTRTAGHELWINPLMSLYWGFELHHVVARHLFLPKLAATESAPELAQGIAMQTALTPSRPWRDMKA